MKEKKAIIDKKDIKILRELERDSRQPAVKIAKKAGLSKDAVLRRINALLGNRILSKIHAEPNYELLGFSSYRLYLKLGGVSRAKEKEIVQHLYSCGCARWLAQTQGTWDIIARFMVRNELEFSEILNEFMQKYGQFIRAKAFGMNTVSILHPISHLLGTDRVILAKMAGPPEKRLAIEKKDYEIMFWLFENARMQNMEIAEKVGLSPDAVAYRIKKLKKLGAWSAFTCWLDRNNIGFLQNKVLVWLKNADRKKTDAILSYCRGNQHMSFYGLTIGGWDMEVDIDARDNRETNKVIREFQEKFPDAVDSYSPQNILKDYVANPLGLAAGLKPVPPKMYWEE